MRISAIFALLISVSVGQDKPAVPFGDIVSCVRAGACKNMTAGTINWFDVVRIPVLTFKDDGWTYALRYDPERPTGLPATLAIFLTPPNETQPTQSVTLDLKGELVRGSLGPQPGERVPADTRNGGLQASLLLHKNFAAAGWYPSGEVIGAEFKPMWQKSADQGLAAIARVLTR